MREIKFRAYSNIRGMVEVKGLEFIKKKISTPSDDGRFWVDDFCDMELMQYTGLKDRNGKEIYEGDIVQHKNGWTGVITWNYVDCAFISENINDRDNTAWLDQDIQTVIGNIYESPELLDANPKE